VYVRVIRCDAAISTEIAAHMPFIVRGYRLSTSQSIQPNSALSPANEDDEDDDDDIQIVRSVKPQRRAVIALDDDDDEDQDNHGWQDAAANAVMDHESSNEEAAEPVPAGAQHGQDQSPAAPRTSFSARTPVSILRAPAVMMNQAGYSPSVSKSKQFECLVQSTISDEKDSNLAGESNAMGMRSPGEVSIQTALKYPTTPGARSQAVESTPGRDRSVRFSTVSDGPGGAANDEDAGQGNMLFSPARSEVQPGSGQNEDDADDGPQPGSSDMSDDVDEKQVRCSVFLGEHMPECASVLVESNRYLMLFARFISGDAISRQYRSHPVWCERPIC